MPDGLNNFFNSLSGQIGNALGNPLAQQKPTIISSGPFRTPFLTPNTLLSSVYTTSLGNGYNRTDNGHPKSLFEETKIRKRSQQPGFTPVNYYRTPTGEIFITTPSNLKSYDESLKDNINSYVLYGDNPQSDFKFSLQDYVRFNSEKNSIETSDGGSNVNFWEQNTDKNPLRLQNYLGTPYDNEDPVYFGFEIIINVQTSPLLNGELEKFIDQFGGDVIEIESRRNIVNQFKNELSRYFKLSSVLGNKESFDGSNLILSTDVYGDSNGRKTTWPNKKYYYVKKISGLEKLIESNTSSTKKSFVDYGKDVLTISFYEDTTLNLGTLASLYKLMYWSRLRGKNIIPENLLRFDCEIVVSELRDFVSLRKSGNMLEILKSNLSRYRYQLFECQFWFNKMTHGDSVDVGSPLEKTDSYDVEMSFKYSNMIFERYDPSSLTYRRLRNGTINPLTSPDFGETSSREYMSRTKGDSDTGTIILGEYNYLSGFTVQDNNNNFSDPIVDVPIVDNTIENLKNSQKVNIYNLSNSSNPVLPETQQDVDIYGKATQKLLDNIKKAALNDAQRKMNEQFRLLNNSLDKIRNSFGIGRIPAPTNVYSNPVGGQFFFDVQNSLRDFAGDTLSGFISRGGQ